MSCAGLLGFDVAACGQQRRRGQPKAHRIFVDQASFSILVMEVWTTHMAVLPQALPVFVAAQQNL